MFGNNCDEEVDETQWTLLGYHESGEPMYWLKTYVDACRQADPDFDAWVKSVAPIR